MKKKLAPLFLVSITTLLMLTGCKEEFKDSYVGDQITALKEKDTDGFTFLLDEGITESNEMHTIEFPEELKEIYLTFIQKAFSCVSFEVGSAKKVDDDTYSVQLTFTPIDVTETTAETDSRWIEDMQSADLAAEVTALLKENEKTLKDKPLTKSETTITAKVKKDGDKFSVAQEDMDKLIRQSVTGYMEPYNMVCDVVDARDFLKSCLDASYKGDFIQFMKHTGNTEEEAAAWYEASFEAPAEFSEDQTARFKAVMKDIYKQCKYAVGVPKKLSGLYNYSVDITFTPNNSVTQAFQAVQNGTFYSEQEVYEGLINALAPYAAAPVYGEETTQNLSWNLNSIATSGTENSELSALANAICPVPE